MPGLAMRRFLSLSTIVFGARLAGAGVGFAAQILLARLVPAETLGIFFLATSVAAVLGIVAAAGYPNVTVRFVSRYRERGRFGVLAAYARQTQRDTLRNAVLVMIAVAGFALVYPAADAETRLAIACGALAIPAAVSIRVNGTFAIAARQFQASWLPDFLGRPVLFLVAIIGLALMGLHLSAVLVVATMAAATTVVAVAQYLWIRPHLPRGEARHDRRLGRLWRATSRPLVIVALFTALFADLDLTILGSLLPAHELAVFGACLKVAFLVDFATQLVQSFAAPDIADGYTRRERGVTERAIAQANLLSVAATLLALSGAAVGGRLILSAFGPDFVAGHAALVVLVAAQVLRAGFGPTLQLMTMVGAQRQIAAVFALAAVVLVLANLLLAPNFGPVGAAAAVLITVLFWTGALALLLYRRTGLRTDAVASLAALRSGTAAPQAG